MVCDVFETYDGNTGKESFMKKKIRGLDLSIEFVCSLIVAISLSFYIYCAHFRFPFEATDFLYIAFIIAIDIIIIRRKLIINKALLIYLLIVLYTGLGYLYSNNPEDGLRQTLFFAIYFVFYWLAMQGGTFLQLMKKIIYIFSLMGMISVFVQFFKPELINAFLFIVLRPWAYENIMWSYNVDGTYTGLTASVSMASFSMAIVFFAAAQKILYVKGKNTDLPEKQPNRMNFINYIIAFLALFGIILTSKRGIFVATVIALLLAIVLDKDIKIRIIKKSHAITLGIGIVLAVVGIVYLIEINDYVIAFISRFTGNNITTGRNEFYKNAINAFSLGSVGTLFAGYGTGSAYLINKTGLHNVYLQLLFDHGLLGLVLYGSFFIVNIKNAIKKRYFFSMCLQIVFLVYCMTGNPLYDYYFFIPYLLFACYEG